MANRVSLALLLAALVGACCLSAGAATTAPTPAAAPLPAPRTFEVGGMEGWVVPASPDVYNQWASRNRFLVGDVLHFKYSLFQGPLCLVTEDEYNKCELKYIRAMLNFGTGDTRFVLDRPGPFYFIGFEHENCVHGQKMVVKVIGNDAPLPAPTPAATPSA